MADGQGAGSRLGSSPISVSHPTAERATQRASHEEITTEASTMPTLCRVTEDPTVTTAVLLENMVDHAVISCNATASNSYIMRNEGFWLVYMPFSWLFLGVGAGGWGECTRREREYFINITQE